MWRGIGAASIAIAGIMAWYGGRSISAGQSPWFMLAYWGVFLFFLIVAMYMVILDIRYIRMQYMMGRREIYMNTLGSEDFRRNLTASLASRPGNGRGQAENSQE